MIRTMILYAARIRERRPKWQRNDGKKFRSLEDCFGSLKSELTEDVTFTQLED